MLQAVDAAELIEVAYEPLPATVSKAQAAAPGAPRVWDDCPDNVCFVHLEGDKAATEAAFADAAHVVSGRFVINRVTAATMEPRGSIGDYNAADGRYTIYTRCSARIRSAPSLRTIVLKVPESKVRVVAGDIGGSFGMKSAVYNEVALVLLASQADRPAGQMGQHALRGVPQRRPGPRQRHRGRAGARHATARSSALRVKSHRECRRLSADRHDGRRRQSRLARRRLPHAGDPRRCHRRLQPHQSDPALSRQRPAGSGVS